MAACRVLCVSCTVFSWDRLLVCLLCCGSMSCVVCESYGVRLRCASCAVRRDVFMGLEGRIELKIWIFWYLLCVYILCVWNSAVHWGDGRYFPNSSLFYYICFDPYIWIIRLNCLRDSSVISLATSYCGGGLRPPFWIKVNFPYRKLNKWYGCV